MHVQDTVFETIKTKLGFYNTIPQKNKIFNNGKQVVQIILFQKAII